MFEVGMGIIRQYRDYTAKGEITSIHDDADGETLISVMYDDGAVKTYTENCVEQIIYTDTYDKISGGQGFIYASSIAVAMIVTEEVIW